MKKMTVRGFVMLFLALFAGCATIPVKPITQDDLPDLKGKWKGFRYGDTYTSPIEIEIFNENLEGRITFHETRFGTVDYPFFGRIEDGKLVMSWGKNAWVNLRLYKGGDKLQLKGEYQWWQWGGTMSLRKVLK